MSLRHSYTATVERNVLWQGGFASEPYEAAWASEAIFFLRALEVVAENSAAAPASKSPPTASIGPTRAHASTCQPEKDQVTFCKVAHFGGFLRLAGTLAPGKSIKVLVSLALKE